MKSFIQLKRNHIAHLQWCLEMLTYHKRNENVENCEYLFRRIFELILELESMDDMEALTHYRTKTREESFLNAMREFNLELDQ